jgi:hypothetical protein
MSPRLLLATVAAIALPGAVLAQGAPTINSTVTLGFSNSSLDIGAFPAYDVDITTTTLDMDNEIWFGPNFVVGLDFGISMSDIDATGGSAEADLLSFAFEPAYHFGNGAYVGVYYRMGDLDASIAPLPVTLGVDTRQTGIFGGYENGPLWVEAFYGTSDSDPGLPTGIDITDYGIAASYDVAPNFELFGNITRTNIEIGTADIDLTLYGIGGEYDFGNGMSLYGSVGQLDVGLPIPGIDLDATQFSIGFGYDLAQGGMGFPGVVSFEFTRTSSDLAGLTDLDVNTISLGLTIPLGPNASSTPLNSSTQVARGAYRSAVAGGLASLR